MLVVVKSNAHVQIAGERCIARLAEFALCGSEVGVAMAETNVADSTSVA